MARVKEKETNGTTGIAYLDDLVRDINAVTDEKIDKYQKMLRPVNKGKGEEEVGVVSLMLRKLWTLGGMLRSKMQRGLLMAALHTIIDHPEEIHEAEERNMVNTVLIGASAIQAAEIEILHQRIDLLHDFFWAAARRELNVPFNVSIGIRDGWMLITRPADDDDEDEKEEETPLIM